MGYIEQITIESILGDIGYDDIDFVSYDEANELYFYNGYIDTCYNIQVIVLSDSEIEVWDCIADEENYVKSTHVCWENGIWELHH